MRELLPNLGPLRGGTGETSGPGSAAPGRAAVALSLRASIPIVDYILELERTNPDRQIAVLIPELVERHWYHYFLHNQRAELLKALLLAKGSPKTILVTVPWHIVAKN